MVDALPVVQMNVVEYFVHPLPVRPVEVPVQLTAGSGWEREGKPENGQRKSWATTRHRREEASPVRLLPPSPLHDVIDGVAKGGLESQRAVSTTTLVRSGRAHDLEENGGAAARGNETRLDEGAVGAVNTRRTYKDSTKADKKGTTAWYAAKWL